MNNKKYRVAIVGCGGISNAHGNAWRNLPEIEIVGACDEKLEPLKRFATEYNVENTYNDLRQMLEKQQPDVLVVATWPSNHLKNVLEAVRCGVKGILVEKPITVNTTQLEQMIQVTERANIRLMEAFMYRQPSVDPRRGNRRLRKGRSERFAMPVLLFQQDSQTDAIGD